MTAYMLTTMKIHGRFEGRRRKAFGGTIRSQTVIDKQCIIREFLFKYCECTE